MEMTNMAAFTAAVMIAAVLAFEHDFDWYAIYMDAPTVAATVASNIMSDNTAPITYNISSTGSQCSNIFSEMLLPNYYKYICLYCDRLNKS